MLKRLLLFSVVAIPAIAQIPPIPTNVTAQAISGNSPRIVINWHSTPGPWLFNLYRSVDDSLHFSRRAEILGTHFFEDRNVMPGRRYYYYLRTALRDSELVESPRSAIVSAVVGTASGVRGTIRGTIRDDSTGQPIRNVRVRFYRAGSYYGGVFDLTDSLGRYEATIDSGRYLIRAEPDPHPNSGITYLSEWFDDSPSPATATIVLVGNQTLFVADFGLARYIRQRYVHIRGSVTNEQGVPLSGAMVAVMRSIQEMNTIAATEGRVPGLDREARTLESIGYCRGLIWWGRTDGQGTFEAENIPANGSYIVAAAKQGYYLQYFNHVSDPSQATIITAANDTNGVNFQLRLRPSAPNSLRGTIIDSTGTQVPSRVILFPRPPHPTTLPIVVHSDSSGNYVFSDVATGLYLVLAVPYSNYTAGFYKQGAFGITQWQQADTVVVSGNVQAIDVGVVSIQSNGLTRVSGISTATTGEPIVGGRIVVHNLSGQVVGVGLSTPTGGYVIDAIPFGQVTLTVDGEPYNMQQIVLNIPPGTFSLSNVNIALTRFGSTGVSSHSGHVDQFRVEQNYPNPFNPYTTIEFTIPATAGGQQTRLQVYDLLGREVATIVDDRLESGKHVVPFNASGLASGVYYYRFSVGEFSAVRRMIVLK